MHRITLPADLARKAGAADVDCKVDDNGWIDVYASGVRLTCFSPADLGRLAPLLPKRLDSTELVDKGDRRNARPAAKPVRARSSHGTLSGNRARAARGAMR